MPPTRRGMRAARVAGACLLIIVAIPALASGIYAVAARDFPQDLPTWLGSAPGIGFIVLGIAGCIVGAAALALSLALMVWPEKALAKTAPLGRMLARLVSSRSRGGRRSS